MSRRSSASTSTGEQAAIGLGWPVDAGATRGAIVGARQGILELVEIPSALRDSVTPGVAALSFGVRDVEGLTATAGAAGLAVDGPHDITGVDGAVSTLTRVDRRRHDLRAHPLRLTRISGSCSIAPCRLPSNRASS